MPIVKLYWKGYPVTPEQAVELASIGEVITTDPNDWFWRIWND